MVEIIELKAAPRVKYLVVLAFLIATVVLLELAVFRWPDQLFHASEFRAGDQLVSKINSFKKAHGYLPETLDEIGIHDSDSAVYYQRQSAGDYIVWFGTTLGESEVYHSETNKWD